MSDLVEVEVPRTVQLFAPVVTKENVDVAIEHVVTDREAFLAQIPDMTEANLAYGDIAAEGIPGQ